MHGLATFPDQLALVREDPALIPGLVEESLRWATPAKHFMRNATADTEVNGVAIEAGDRLMCLFVSANYDEDVFPEPHRFDATRRPNPQLSFSYGPHVCLGQHIARTQIEEGFHLIAQTMKNPRRTGASAWRPFFGVWGLKGLPIEIDPAPIPEA